MTQSVLSRVINVGAWSLANAIALRLLNLISLYVAARALTAAEYGSLALMLNTAQSWSIFLAGGISLTMSKYVGEFKTQTPARAASIISTLSCTTIALWFVVFLITAIFSHQITTIFFNNNLQVSDIWILLFWVLLMALQTTMQGAVTGLEQFKKNAIFAIIGGLISLFAILVLVPNERNWIVTALVAGGLITFGGMVNLVISTTRPWRDQNWKYFDSNHISLIVKFGLPAFVGSVAITQAQWYANLRVSNSAGGLSELAGLNIALQWYSVILFIPGAVSNAMLPLLARLASERKQQLKLMYTTFLLNLCISISIAFGAIYWRDDILNQYGSQYVQYAPIFMYLAIASAINGIASIFTQQIASLGRGFLLLYLNLAWGVFFLCANYILSEPTGGSAIHVARSYVFANLIQAILMIGAAVWLSKEAPLSATLNSKNKK